LDTSAVAAHHFREAFIPLSPIPMKHHSFFRTPARVIPLALVLLGGGSLAMAADFSSHAQVAVTTVTSAATILPYGAVGHDATTASAPVLPYGAMSGEATTASAAILPYGAMSRDTTLASATILPYGAIGPHAAP
jgi:hypothetical protein